MRRRRPILANDRKRRAGDTFLTDVPFTAEPNRLTAEETINGVLVSAVLTK